MRLQRDLAKEQLIVGAEAPTLGWGAEFMRLLRLTGRSQCHLLIAMICGFVCLAATSSLAAEHKFDGVYVGKRLLVKGDSATCPVQENASAKFHGATLTFTNGDLKKFTITFHPSRDGSFGEVYTAEGGEAVSIHGRVVGNDVDADVINYATDPPCEHHWHLKKQ